MTIYIVDSQWRHQNYEWTHMELCSKQKVWNNSKHVLYFRFFRIATLCFTYCFAHSWHSLDELHEVVTWNGFPTVLKEFPEMLSTCWPFCLHSALSRWKINDGPTRRKPDGMACCCGMLWWTCWCLQFWIDPQQCHKQSCPTPSHHLLHASQWEPCM